MQIPTRAGGAERRSVHLRRRKSTGPHQEIDIYLNAVGPVRMIREIEVSLPQRVVVDPILKPVAETCKDLLNSSSDFRAVAERCFAVDVSDVVQVDSDGKPREVEIKKVESWSALEDKLSSEIGMLWNSVSSFRSRRIFSRLSSTRRQPGGSRDSDY